MECLGNMKNGEIGPMPPLRQMVFFFFSVEDALGVG